MIQDTNPDSDPDVIIMSFRQVSCKSAGDSMRNANKSKINPYSAMVREANK